MAGNIIVYTLSQGTNREKYYKIKHQRVQFRLQWEINTFKSICFLIRHVFTVFRRKLHGPNPSQMDIKVLIPAQQLYFTNTNLFFNWEIGKQLIRVQEISWDILNYQGKIKMTLK